MEDFNLHRWIDRIDRDGLTPALRYELCKALRPCVSLRDPLFFDEEPAGISESDQIGGTIEWDIKLSIDDPHHSLPMILDILRKKGVLPDLLPDFSALLREVLDLMRELGDVDDKYDLSYVHQPSIGEHPQNNDFQDWTVLIILTRDAWHALMEQFPERAYQAADAWSKQRYPLFRRLAFFAAAKSEVIPPRRALDWLLAENQWWLWSVETQREAIRLLVSLAAKWNTSELAELEQAILTGSPRAMYKDDIEPERMTRIMEQDILLLLAKLDSAGAKLGLAGKNRLNELYAKYPKWKLASDESDEFPFWTGDKGDEESSEVEALGEFASTKGHFLEVVEWIKRYPEVNYLQENAWRQHCREDFPTIAKALSSMAKENTWPIDYWRMALQTWSEEKLVDLSWNNMGPVIARIPDENFQCFIHSASWWLKSVSNTFDSREVQFLEMCRRVLRLEYKSGCEDGDPVTLAINHPVGHITEALLRWWYRSSLEEKTKLPEELAAIFTELCDTQVGHFRHARVLLASNVIPLFQVDSEWTSQKLLPLFSWRKFNSEAHAIWEGFLRSPRLYHPLLESIKKQFLETAQHYSILRTRQDQYASLLLYSSLDPRGVFTKAELASATRVLPPKGLQHTVRMLARALDSADKQRARYWANRVRPYVLYTFPKLDNSQTRAMLPGIAELCVAAGEKFPEAFYTLRRWLQPTKSPGHSIHKLAKSDPESSLCSKFPKIALEFLDSMIDEPVLSVLTDLRTCLRQIRDAMPGLAEDGRFIRLRDFLHYAEKDID